jgi:UDP-2,3-diacylglucosamine hydrolase
MTRQVQVDGDLVIIGDVHLDAGDREVGEFCAMLEETAGTCVAMILAGDLFNLWIGRKDIQREHIKQVADALRAVRRRGVQVHYLEGNRDYFIARECEGDLFDTVTTAGLELQAGGHRIFAAHGDMANLNDRQYHRWRRFSRSSPIWFLFNLLPAGTRMRLAERIESRFRRTNQDYKIAFPEQEVRAYAGAMFREGVDLVVLGHFHIEKDLQASTAGTGRILVLPEWKGSRRCLRIGKGGEVLFQAT